MTDAACQRCGETNEIDVEPFVADDGRRMVRVTCHQIVHEEPIETHMEDPGYATVGDVPTTSAGFGDTAIVCTWNPDLADDLPDERRAAAVDATRRGEPARFDWSIGTHRHNIGPGTTAWLFRQGNERGVVARGRVASLPFEDAHWDGSERSARYVTIDWHVMLPDADVLAVDVLLEDVPDGNWNGRYQSGSPIGPSAHRDLEARFERHLDEVGWPATD